MTRHEDRRSPSATEYALVAIVMGAIGLVGLPRPDRSRPEAPVVAPTPVETALVTLRDAVAAYRADHGRWPGSRAQDPQAASERFTAQLTRITSRRGEVAPHAWHPTARFGPYLFELPENPANGLASVRVLGPDEEVPTEPDGTSGWLFDPRSGTVRANGVGTVPGTRRRLYDL